MGLINDMKAQINRAKDQLVEASGIDVEETSRSIAEFKDGVGGLGKQLAKAGKQMLASVDRSNSTEGAPSSSSSSGHNADDNRTSDTSPQDSDAPSKRKEAEGEAVSADEEIRMIEDRLKLLRDKRMSDQLSAEDGMEKEEASETEPTDAERLQDIEDMEDDAESRDSISSNMGDGKVPPPIVCKAHESTGLKQSVTISVHTLIAGAVLLLIVAVGILFGLSTCSGDDMNKQAPSSTQSESSMGLSNLEGAQVSISIECEENWIFSKYDIDILIDDAEIGNLDHGKSGTFVINLAPGSHVLTVQNEEDPSVDGSVSFDTEAYSEFRFRIHCTDSQVEIDEYEHVNVPMSSEEAVGSPLSVVESDLKAAGFEEVTTVEDASLPVGETARAGTVHEIRIDGEASFEVGDSFYSDASVEIVYLTVGDIHPPRDAASFEGMAYGVVRAELEEAGFSNIKVEGYEGGTPSDQAIVDHVEIGWMGFLGFTTSDSYSIDEEVRIYLADSTDRGSGGSDSGAGEEILTVDNSDDLRTLLTQSETNAAWFASRYQGRVIEFDGFIGGIMNHGEYDTRYDVLILAGEYGGSSLGPNFRLSDVNTSDMGIEDLYLPSWMSSGQNVHVVAEVDGYDETRDWLELDPVSVTKK